MQSPTPFTPDVVENSESPARILALAVAADGRIDEHELESLERPDAFRRIGISRDRFVDLTRDSLEAIGPDLNKRLWLGPSELHYLEALLCTVPDAELRLLICRLAAAVLVADGPVTRGERLVYDHVCARWCISQAMVVQAIRADRFH